MPAPTRRARSAALVVYLVLATALAGCSDEVEPPDAAPTPTPTPTASEPTPTQVPYKVAPEIRTRVLPQLAAPGSAPQRARDAYWVVEVTDPKARPGRVVELEARSGDVWGVVDTAKVRPGGRVTFTSSLPGRLRVVTNRAKGRVGRTVHTRDATAVSLTDDFDNLNPALWQTRAQGYAGVRMCSRADDSAVAVTDGVLQVKVLDDPAAGTCSTEGRAHAYRLNGHIGTEGRYSFTHGFAAARIKFQSREGQHGAFWLQTPWIGNGSAWDNGAEIDVMEYFGDTAPHGGLASFAYWWPESGGAKVGGWLKNHQELGSNWSSQYHVFSVEWTPSEYIFRVDDKIAWRTSEGVSGVPQFLVLSLLSSDYELKHMRDTDLPASMKVDWVRTWVTGTQSGTYLG